MSTTAVIPMPMRGDRIAPTFDPAKPRGLRRFWEDFEMLANRANLTDQTQLKQRARSYVPIEVADIWEMLREYSDATKSFADFKKAVTALYPGAKEERRWSRTDLFELTTAAMHKGIATLEDWAPFFAQYYAIAAYLISKNHCSNDEAGRKIIEALPTNILQRVLNRLQVKVPDHEADAAYSLNEINDAVTWVLSGGGTLGVPAYAQSAATSGPTSGPTSGATSGAAKVEPGIKQEDIHALIEAFTKMANRPVAAAPATSAPATAPQQPRPTYQSGFPPRPAQPTFSTGCHYCDAEGHNIASCPLVEADIRTGHVARNEQGRIILPNGSYVPRSTPGKNMRERVFNWHQQFPNRLAVNYLAEDAPDANTYMMTVDLPAMMSNSLSASDRLAALEKEMYALRSKQQFDGVYMPPRPRPGPRAAGTTSQDARVQAGNNPEARQAPVTVARDQAPAAAVPAAAPAPVAPRAAEPTTEREHPFRNARDANNIPPVSTEPAKPRMLAPVQSDAAEDFVFSRFCRDATIQMSAAELMSVAPGIRDRTRAYLTPAPVKERTRDKKRDTAAVLDLGVSTGELQYPTDEELEEQIQRGHPGIYELPHDDYEAPRDDDKMEVASESGSLRTIFAIIDNREDVECILDPGCQIVAMSENVALKLGLPWDPRVVLNMQSANGQTNPSLGLARNVPFQFANMTIYLQVHVIREAAYEVLLGRPFDDITRSVVHNLAGGHQTVTLHCPNSKIVATIPTFPRSTPAKPAKGQPKKQGF